MRGQILTYSPETGEGIISGQDGKRYTFRGTEYRGNVLAIRLGMEVDFEVREDGSAAGVIPLPGASGAPIGSQPVYAKSKIAAGLLAIFLGNLGIHKFYLGYTTQGVILLLITLFLWWLIFPLLIVGVIVLIEGIIYLTKTDAQFDEEYVQHKKLWF
ncbi:TM2 domain-containing membrane protein YozV [Rhizomicrobium palustre]|uniref:TM2 domain-containing membrane protein YozV n=1 Tax=Rhizomicrobium palustre TaxID=189966 RepID=A0A846N3X9_9PROT|nr:TM2 domain-containing protein [Rhizomicrobium palustre]NIK90323.1 TM2 domain-containing membrane protein YozV [Rhizomicrobium palustre]